jgi:hypothetical protein
LLIEAGGEPAEALERVVAQPSGVAGGDTADVGGHRAQQGLHLELGEVGAGACVRPVSLTDVRAVRPVDVVALGIWEARLVEICGAEQQHHS